MSTATLEREAAPKAAVSWEPWTVGNDGVGERRYFVFRHGVDFGGNRSEYHCNKKGDAIRYTMAGAEKKAHELNKEVADAKRRDAYFAKRDAEQRALQDMAKEVREVAQCGTANSEMIARWIIGNFTYTDEVQELREERDEARAEAGDNLRALEDAEAETVKVRQRCNSLADEARVLMAELGAFGTPVFSDPLEFAAGNTPLEKVIDMSRNLVAALEAYEQEA